MNETSVTRCRLAAMIALVCNGVAVAAAPGSVPAARVREAAVMSASVIPIPAHVEPGGGAFALHAGMRISIPRDPRAARVARYFADLLQQTRGIKLAIDAPGSEQRSQPIVFTLKDQWKASPHIQARMRELGVANEEALQSYFVRRMARFLSAHRRGLMA